MSFAAQEREIVDIPAKSVSAEPPVSGAPSATASQEQGAGLQLEQRDFNIQQAYQTEETPDPSGGPPAGMLGGSSGPPPPPGIS